MGPHSKIGTFTLCKGLDLLQLDAYASIGRGNWITGFPSGSKTFFAHQEDRKPILIVGEHSAITNRHLIDCTNAVTIGRFTTLAGFQSQILTHSIDLAESRQSSQPVRIGDYCFIGTKVVLLGGSELPSYCVLGAMSLLNKPLADEYTLYGGVPAKAIKKLNKDDKYFTRPKGFVH
jgi:acetyltransferase-like isoleucine patch superfamily enzyme